MKYITTIHDLNIPGWGFIPKGTRFKVKEYNKRFVYVFPKTDDEHVILRLARKGDCGVVTIDDCFNAKKAKLFPTREAARKYLEEDWEEYLNEKFADPFCDEVDMKNSFHEEDYAVVRYERYELARIREWHLIQIEE